jgi:hypothetical protein
MSRHKYRGLKFLSLDLVTVVITRHFFLYIQLLQTMSVRHSLQVRPLGEQQPANAGFPAAPVIGRKPRVNGAPGLLLLRGLTEDVIEHILNDALVL